MPEKAFSVCIKDSVFIEPACGDGNFLSVILKRKLDIVTKKYRRSAYDWERNSLLALGSMYGVDIMLDNDLACQDRLFEIWDTVEDMIFQLFKHEWMLKVEVEATI